jgi:hypothetical protein
MCPSGAKSIPDHCCFLFYFVLVFFLKFLNILQAVLVIICGLAYIFWCIFQVDFFSMNLCDIFFSSDI